MLPTCDYRYLVQSKQNFSLYLAHMLLIQRWNIWQLHQRLVRFRRSISWHSTKIVHVELPFLRACFQRGRTWMGHVLGEEENDHERVVAATWLKGSMQSWWTDGKCYGNCCWWSSGSSDITSRNLSIDSEEKKRILQNCYWDGRFTCASFLFQRKWRLRSTFEWAGNKTEKISRLCKEVDRRRTGMSDWTWILPVLVWNYST